MKRTLIRLEEVAAWPNLLLAAHKAARGKRQRPDVAAFLADLPARLQALGAGIADGTAPLGQYRSFVIHDPKCRLIHAAAFPERVLHHAILNLAEPVFEKTLLDSSYACRPGKGVHRAVSRVQQLLRRHAWFAKIDVQGYFPSIPHEPLKTLLARRFNLETSVERAGVCGFPGAGQGATTRNGHSIPFSRSCNAALRPENRAIQPVALFTKRVNPKYITKLFRTIMLYILASGQRRFLGSREVASWICWAASSTPHQLRRQGMACPSVRSPRSISPTSIWIAPTGGSWIIPACAPMCATWTMCCGGRIRPRSCVTAWPGWMPICADWGSPST